MTASVREGAATGAEGRPSAASTSTDNSVTFDPIGADTTPPVISHVLRGTPGQNGWFTSNVLVGFAVSDDGSAISNRSGCDGASVSADTTGTTFTCTATSAGGTSTHSVTIKRDATRPTLAPRVSPDRVVVGGTATATANAADATSGLASQSCAPLDTGSVGSKTVSCTATDRAGNTGTGTAAYTVVYPFTGFLSPVVNAPALNSARPGTSVPLRFTLGGDFGPSAVSSVTTLPIQCSTLAPLGSASAAQGTLTTGTTYTYAWSTDKRWNKTCRQVVLTLNDGTVQRANFRF